MLICICLVRFVVRILSLSLSLPHSNFKTMMPRHNFNYFQCKVKQIDLIIRRTFIYELSSSMLNTHTHNRCQTIKFALNFEYSECCPLMRQLLTLQNFKYERWMFERQRADERLNQILCAHAFALMLDLIHCIFTFLH